MVGYYGAQGATSELLAGMTTARGGDHHYSPYPPPFSATRDLNLALDIVLFSPPEHRLA